RLPRVSSSIQALTEPDWAMASPPSDAQQEVDSTDHSTFLSPARASIPRAPAFLAARARQRGVSLSLGRARCPIFQNPWRVLRSSYQLPLGGRSPQEIHTGSIGEGHGHQADKEDESNGS